MSTQQVFAYDPRSVAAARHWVGARLADVAAPLLGQVELMVSELASNAISHARSAFTVRIERAGHHTRISVADAGEGVPRVQAPNMSALHGRGLLIVDALAAQWGVDYLRDHSGKIVWFTVADDAPTSA